MFGLFQKKTLDREKCVESVALAIIDAFVDDSLLNIDKFMQLHQFSSRIEQDPEAENRFFEKKLVLICSVAHTVLSREELDELIQPVVERTHTLLIDVVNMKPSLSTTQLAVEADRLAKLRFSTGAKEAGQLIENDFTDFVFKFIPAESDIDSRYLLYKQLSGFERGSLFRIGSAIRSSKV